MAGYFSFTVPRISEEEEKAEREALSEDEKRAIHDDMYGQDNEVEETDEMKASGPLLLCEAIESIAREDKMDYLEAVERSPRIVEQECNPIAFLRSENYDAWAAANRLVGYWKFRRELFGDKAFLPMTQDSALASDMEALAAGVMLILPDDIHGRTVIFFDRTGMKPHIASRESFMRMCFYTLSVAMEKESSQKRGIVLIGNFQNIDVYKEFDRKLMKQASKLIRYLPLQRKAAHYVVSPRNTVLQLLIPVLKLIIGKHSRLRLEVHPPYDQSETVLSGLARFGLFRENLPSRIGGDLTNEYHKAWVADRRRMEMDRDGDGLHINKVGTASE